MSTKLTDKEIHDRLRQEAIDKMKDKVKAAKDKKDIKK